jgi:hypothetical protein
MRHSLLVASSSHHLSKLTGIADSVTVRKIPNRRAAMDANAASAPCSCVHQKAKRKRTPDPLLIDQDDIVRILPMPTSPDSDDTAIANC